MDKTLARDAVDAILAMSEWARNVSDEYLDSDPEERRRLVAGRQQANAVVRRLNAEIAAPAASEGQK